MRRLPVVVGASGRARVDAARPEPPIVGERLLATAEVPLVWLDRLVESAIPPAANPFAQTGAIANVLFLVAAATGTLLLFWYSPSVHTAHASLEAMRASPYTAQLVRSLHRYSSDGCMVFVLLHALRLTLARKFAGARWLAWVTGIVLLGLLWFVGWIGYWLVWDEAARQVALGTSKMLDVLPVFAEPMTLSFLTDDRINSLLFFIVFFFHMLIPLAMGVALWLHITRLGRAKFLTTWPMTAWIVASLVVVSLASPARSAAPAHMTAAPAGFSMDGWYLLPIALTDRLGGGALWALTLVSGVVLLTVPWWVLRARARVAEVDAAKCNGCTLCHEDCPYDAIRMVARTDGREPALLAAVDADKCVGCGICAGSCDSAGIGLPVLTAVRAREQMDRWIDRALQEHDAPRIAFLCAGSAAASLSVDPATGACAELPGYHCMAVACIGWVHMLTVERALRHGAAGVLLVGCGPSDCTYREGGRWTRARLDGARPPALRFDHADRQKVTLLELDRTRRAELVAAAARLREATFAPPARRTRVGPRSLFAGLLLTAGAAAATVGPSHAAYGGPPSAGAEVVVAIKHAGSASERCRKLGDEEKAKLPPHMRRDEICERGRAAVRLRVRVDGEVKVDRAYSPHGLRKDGNSIAIERVPVAAGPHHVAVQLGDTWDAAEWTLSDERDVRVTATDLCVVRFEKGAGFSWDCGPRAQPAAGAPGEGGS